MTTTNPTASEVEAAAERLKRFENNECGKVIYQTDDPFIAAELMSVDRTTLIMHAINTSEAFHLLTPFETVEKIAELATLRERNGELEQQLDATECSHQDEEAAHQETLRMLSVATDKLATLEKQATAFEDGTLVTAEWCAANGFEYDEPLEILVRSLRGGVRLEMILRGQGAGVYVSQHIVSTPIVHGIPTISQLTHLLAGLRGAT